MYVMRFAKGVALISILLFVVSAVAVQIPAPFDKAKEMALKARPNSNGVYVVTYEYFENDIQVMLLVGYAPKHRLIAIGSSIDGIIYEYNEVTGEISVATPFGRFPVSDSDREEFFNRVFKIFQLLVCRGLI